MNLKLNLTAGAVALAFVLPAAAHSQIYEASLLGSSETPPVNSAGSGIARVTIDFDELTMRVEASFSGLTGNVTASHIHCCNVATTTSGVAFGSTTLAGFPTGGTSGSYDVTFANMANRAIGTGNWTANFFNNFGGSTGQGAFDALVAGLNSGQAYLNIHTTSFGGGEIRAQLLPVPEPETYALMLAGLAGVLTIARRKKQA